jgi:hypothetical protein
MQKLKSALTGFTGGVKAELIKNPMQRRLMDKN